VSLREGGEGEGGWGKHDILYIQILEEAFFETFQVFRQRGVEFFIIFSIPRKY
jgi:hypothetical protein